MTPLQWKDFGLSSFQALDQVDFSTCNIANNIIANNNIHNKNDNLTFLRQNGHVSDRRADFTSRRRINKYVTFGHIFRRIVFEIWALDT
jgi:hypothetical protein